MTTVSKSVNRAVACFYRHAGSRLRPIANGETILVVEASESVPWTKPDELVYDPDGPLPKLGCLDDFCFQAVLFDGSVRVFQCNIPENDLRALITRSVRK